MRKKSTIVLFLFVLLFLQLDAKALLVKPDIKFSDNEIVLKYKKLSKSNTQAWADDEFLYKLSQQYGLVDDSASRINILHRQIQVAKKSHKIKKLHKLKKIKKELQAEMAVLKLDKEISRETLKAVIEKLNEEKFTYGGYRVEKAYVNQLFEINAVDSNTVNDPQVDQQWIMSIVEPDALWDKTEGEGAVVAVIDTGVDYNHEDLAANIWSNTDEIPGNGIDDDGNGYIDDVRGWDFIDQAASNCAANEDCSGEDNEPMDVNSHGTHVSGIIAAVKNNGKGVTGIAPKAKIMPLRAGYSTGFSGFLKTTDILEALTYAINNDADVINMSFAGYELDVLQEVLNLSYDLGIVAVAAAGNNSSDYPIYPAALNSVIAVGATADGTAKSYFSNYGSWVDIVAPGSWLLSTVPNNAYGNKSGTSMASPVVAGIVALIKSKNKTKELTVAQVRSLLDSGSMETTFKRDSSSGLTIRGATAKINFPLEVDELNVPSNVLIGEAVTFSAKASDPSSEIVSYEWRSNLNGTLNDQASFSVSGLNIGAHTISVRALNAAGQWSNPVYKSVTVGDTRGVEPFGLVDRFKMAIFKNNQLQRLAARSSSASKPQIRAYKWVSSRDGQVSSSRILDFNRLSSGYHKISLSVMDRSGVWSSPLTKVLNVN
ncbi:MAG: S8 family serine peptidase [Candidatus Caenarcaniphilales bacterium]|nr:S8 family serine peptidase [Candidatus Caenarcaniphilales bacterium]